MGYLYLFNPAITRAHAFSNLLHAQPARLWCTTPEIAVGYRTLHGAVACLVCADNKAGLTDVISGGHRAVTSLCALT